MDESYILKRKAETAKHYRRRFNEAVEQALYRYSGKPCCICGARGTGVGTFTPFVTSDWGGEPDDRRVFVYSVCDLHAHAHEEIEEGIRLTLAVAQN